MQRLTRSILLASAAAVLGACSDRPDPTVPGARTAVAAAPSPTQGRVAFVRYEGRFPKLYLQNADGSDQQLVHFVGVHDRVEGNYPQRQLPVSDESIVAMGPLEWSPDGSQLAVVLSVGFDQSQVVVMNADGHNIRVASLNGQYILSDVDWSPDGQRIAYGMATLPGARGVELFTTDLRTFEVRRLTVGAFFGVRAELRWSEDGSAIFLSEITGEERAEPYNYINRVRRIDYATGASETVAEGIVGEMQGILRSGKHALISRKVSLEGSDYLRDLMVVELTTGRGPVLQSGTNFWSAELLSGDREALVVSNVSTDPYSTALGFALQSLSGGSPEWLRSIPPDAWVADVTKN